MSKMIVTIEDQSRGEALVITWDKKNGKGPLDKEHIPSFESIGELITEHIAGAYRRKIINTLDPKE